MSTSNDYDSLHNFVPSTEINISPENDIISMTTDIFEECVEQESSRTLSSFCISRTVPYQSYINYTALVPASEKTNIILAVCFGYIDGFSLEKEPYSSLLRNSRPNFNILKKEIIQREPSTKKLRGKKMAELLAMLRCDSFKVGMNPILSIFKNKKRSCKRF